MIKNLIIIGLFTIVVTQTDIGITGGGKGTHQIYVNGIPDHVIKNQNVVDHVVNEVRKKLSSLN